MREYFSLTAGDRLQDLLRHEFGGIGRRHIGVVPDAGCGIVFPGSDPVAVDGSQYALWQMTGDYNLVKGTVYYKLLGVW